MSWFDAIRRGAAWVYTHHPVVWVESELLGSILPGTGSGFREGARRIIEGTVGEGDHVGWDDAWRDTDRQLFSGWAPGGDAPTIPEPFKFPLLAAAIIGVVLLAK